MTEHPVARRAGQFAEPSIGSDRTSSKLSVREAARVCGWHARRTPVRTARDVFPPGAMSEQPDQQEALPRRVDGMAEPVSVHVPTPVGPPVRSVRAEMEVHRPETPSPFSAPTVWAEDLSDRFRQPIGEARDHFGRVQDLLDVVGGRQVDGSVSRMPRFCSIRRQTTARAARACSAVKAPFRTHHPAR